MFLVSESLVTFSIRDTVNSLLAEISLLRTLHHYTAIALAIMDSRFYSSVDAICSSQHANIFIVKFRSRYNGHTIFLYCFCLLAELLTT